MTGATDGNPARPVRDEDAFDVDAVAAYLGRGPIAEVRQFAGGAGRGALGLGQNQVYLG